MFIKKLIASSIVLFALATGMASIGGTQPTTQKTANALTPYTQTALLVQNIAVHHAPRQVAAVK